MKILRWLGAIVLCAFAGQYLLAMALPNLVMEILYWRGGELSGYNRLLVNPIPDETSRSVVRPSPDLLYGSCIYNLENGALVIEAPVPARYWSMQFYQMNTGNFAGISNQREQRHRVGSTVKVTLISADDSPGDYEGEVIQSPTERGIVLLRLSAIGDLSRQMAALAASSCRPAQGDLAFLQNR